MGEAVARQGADDGTSSDAAAARPAPTATDDLGRPDPAASVRLSAREVELVIARALELQQDRETTVGESLSLRDVQAVAAQVGVAPELVRRALDDVRLRVRAEEGSGLLDRLLGPRRVAGALVVPATPDEVRTAVATWMTSDEGLQRAGARDGVDRWVKDTRLLTQVRHGMQATRADGALRGLRGVTSRVDEAVDGTLVAVEADTSTVRTTNALLLGIGAALGVAAGTAAAVVVPGTAVIGSDVAQFAAGLGVPVLGGAAVSTIVRVSWLARVRTAVGRALDGISMTAQEDPAAARRRDDDWRSVARRWLGGD